MWGKNRVHHDNLGIAVRLRWGRTSLPFDFPFSSIQGHQIPFDLLLPRHNRLIKGESISLQLEVLSIIIKQELLTWKRCGQLIH
jgi:hypothetical protein